MFSVKFQARFPVYSKTEMEKLEVEANNQDTDSGHIIPPTIAAEDWVSLGYSPGELFGGNNFPDFHFDPFEDA